MVDSATPDPHRGTAPHAGVGAAANSEEQPAPVEQTSLAAPGMTEAMMKLATFWHDENADISSIDATHEIWRNPEMPLARIKKIMRIDEDVKMISAEVPILFSKAASIFIRELTLRAWIQTEEAKRRTLQRSDIALAITKYDMFDFLIDIVPRDEIQVKPTKKQEENHPVLSAEQLQLLMQLSQGQQQGQGQGASAAAVLNVPQEDDQQEQPTQPSQGVGTSPNKASLETLHQLLQLQLLQQQLNATAAQPQSTEQTGVHHDPA